MTVFGISVDEVHVLRSDETGGVLILRRGHPGWEQELSLGVSEWAALRGAIVGRGSFEAQAGGGILLTYWNVGVSSLFAIRHGDEATVVEISSALLESSMMCLGGG